MPSPAPNTFTSRWSRLLAGGIIILAVLAAYWNSFSGPFIFDDGVGITDNATIRHLWPVWQALTPPHGMPGDGARPVAGRPIVNFSLAVNYAFDGLNVTGYHAFNLLVHILAALTLFGIVRRTLECGRGALTPRATEMRGEGTPPTILALAVALLWALHPLQTESVTYISQRAESLMGLFYLLTLYCFIRGVEDARTSNAERRTSNAESPTTNYKLPTTERRRLLGCSSSLWMLASVGACLLGMASKEVMVSAPLLVLLYDRTFVAGTFREAWAKRRLFYVSLASTWLLLGYLVATTHGRGGSAGFGVNITWWPYALTQFGAIVHYLRLSLWPAPLVFDYGTPVATRAMEIVPYAMMVLLLVIGTTIALWRRPAVGFFGCWFFAILAPTSSVVPVATQTMAEHRMYLALVPLVVLVVLGLYSLLGRRSAVVFLALAVGLGWVTVQRNKDYQSALAIWSDTVAKCPDNGRAHDNLGNILVKMPDRLPDAVVQFEAALQLDPDSSKTHNNLGSVLLKLPGRLPDAIAQFEAALRINPDFMEAHYNLGNALLNIPGRSSDAIVQYEAALRLNPDSVETHINLGNALLNLPGRLPDAIAQYEAAVRLDPGSAQAHYDLGSALLNLPGRSSDAMAQFEAALRIDPDSAETHENYGAVLLDMPGRLPDAIAEFEAALRLDPDSVEDHINLGIALLRMPGHEPDAMVQLQAALRLNPGLVQVREMLNQLQDQSTLKDSNPANPPSRP
ncbi:MAG TPA: tetratricopeptide repeat protein [Opitutaceae bacterium]|nr:tetratricopeptide repeat protein [Opitutaceae bacterium]